MKSTCTYDQLYYRYVGFHILPAYYRITIDCVIMYCRCTNAVPYRGFCDAYNEVHGMYTPDSDDETEADDMEMKPYGTDIAR